ncbi:MAG: DegQ family serine endoprotease [gamma proteobacterium symbiont of Taylorina sp.]|nr:DegQ family serine endoprotease [gamma proteobacterium symbiont of Taylorina sp.]
MTRFKNIIFLPVLFIISFFCLNNSVALPTHDSQHQELPSLAPMLEKVTPAVVNISTKGNYQGSSQLPDFLNDPFLKRFFHFDMPEQNTQQQSHALGSGVIVNAKKGYILTNNHVIDNASKILVTLKDGRKLIAELIGTDPQTDIAVLKVNEANLTALKLSNSDQLRVGDFALAIGHPFGLDQTVTSGIVSGLGRSGLGIEGYEDFIQTDASINPGNSGGALVNLHGELIGINTAMFSKSGGNIGIGFAIPINMAKAVMNQLIKHGSIQRGMLGVQIQDLTPELAAAIGTNATYGAIVSQVIPDSAASKSGIKAGDIIIAVNQRKTHNSSSLRNTIALKRPGDSVILKIIRGEKTLKISAIIGGDKSISSISSDNTDKQVYQAQQLHPALGGASLVQSSQGHGIQVSAVEHQSPAWRSGLRSDDLIVAINRSPVDSFRDLEKLVKKMSKKNQRHTIALNIHRGHSALFLVIR